MTIPSASAKWIFGVQSEATNYFWPDGNDLSPAPENANEIATSFAAQMSHIVVVKGKGEPAETTLRPHGHNYRQRQLPAGNLLALTPIAHAGYGFYNFFRAGKLKTEKLKNRTEPKRTEPMGQRSKGCTCINLL